MALGIKMMAHGPAPHGSVWPDLGLIISSLPASSPSAPSQWGGNSTDHPFYHPLNARRRFPASLKCAKTSWLE